MTIKVLGLHDFREDKDMLLKGLYSGATSGKKNKQRNTVFVFVFLELFHTDLCSTH